MNIQQAHEALCLLLSAREPVMLVGSPGCGKTDLVKQVAADIAFDLMIRHPVVDDPTDYKGLGYANGKGAAEFLPYGDLKKLMETKRPTICFFDDFGQATPLVQAACMQLFLAREINGKKISDKVVFMAATNRKGERAGVTGILEPVKSRFTCIIEIDVSVPLWVRWGRINGMPETLLTFIEKVNPKLLSQFVPTAEIVNSPSPRTLAAVGRIQNLDPAPDYRKQLFAGAAGLGFATEYEGFLREAESWPDLDEMMADPSKVSLPASPSGQYLFAALIGQRITPVNLANLLPIIRKLPIEHQVVIMKTAKERNPNVVNTKAYVAWSVANTEALI
jgi:hypothetical protein